MPCTMMWVHMAPLMRGSVRPWGVSSSRSGEGSSVAKAAHTHTERQALGHIDICMSQRLRLCSGSCRRTKPRLANREGGGGERVGEEVAFKANAAVLA